MPMSAADWGRLLALSLLWGGSFLFVEVALQGMPPLSVVWGRVALAAVRSRPDSAARRAGLAPGVGRLGARWR